MTRCWIVSLAVLLLVSGPLLSDKEQRYQVLPSEHPRLFFTADDVELLRERARSTHEDIWLAVKDYVDSQLGSIPPDNAPLVGSEEDFRSYGNQLIPFAFACVITDDPAYCDLTKDYLLTYAHWSQWDEPGRRDLGLAHMLFGNAIAYDWVYNYLSPEEHLIVRDSLIRWAHRMYRASSESYQEDWTNWWTHTFIQNHFSTNQSALGIAGLVLMGDVQASNTDQDDSAAVCNVESDSTLTLRWEPSLSVDAAGSLQSGQTVRAIAQLTGDEGIGWWQTADGVWVRSDVVTTQGDCEALPLPEWAVPELWMNHANEQLGFLTYLLDGSADGSWHEGINYQNYLLTMLLPYLWNLRQLEGQDMLPHEYLRNYTNWRLSNYVPGSAEPFLLTGDLETWWGNTYNSQALLRFTAREYHDTHAQWLANQIVAADGRGIGSYVTPWVVFEFLYYDDTIEATRPDDVSLSQTFPDFEGVIWRTGWGKDDLLFGLKTGAYGGRFNYQTFVDQVFPWDTGCGVSDCLYTSGHDHADANSFYLYGGEWLAPEAAGYGLADSRFHNTILIDGEGQVRPPDSGVTSPEGVIGTDGRLLLTASTPNFDFVSADATNRYRQIADLQNYTRSVLFVRPGYFVMVDAFAAGEPHTYEWLVHVTGDATREERWIRGAAMGGQVLGIGVAAPETFEFKMGNEVPTQIRLEMAAETPTPHFVTLLYPVNEENWANKPGFSVLVDTDSETALHVQHSNGQTDEVLIGLQFTEPYFGKGPYAHDMRAAVVSYDAALHLSRLFATGGTFITDQINGITLVSNLNSAEAFEASYHDAAVEVYGNILTKVNLYAPGVTDLTVNGEAAEFERDGDFISFGGSDTDE
jgi:hypothetical protein